MNPLKSLKLHWNNLNFWSDTRRIVCRYDLIFWFTECFDLWPSSYQIIRQKHRVGFAERSFRVSSQLALFYILRRKIIHTIVTHGFLPHAPLLVKLEINCLQLTVFYLKKKPKRSQMFEFLDIFSYCDEGSTVPVNGLALLMEMEDKEVGAKPWSSGNGSRSHVFESRQWPNIL